MWPQPSAVQTGRKEQRFTRAEYQVETESSLPRDLECQANDNQGLAHDGCIAFACDAPCQSHRSRAAFAPSIAM
jgi:hypothetical protein